MPKISFVVPAYNKGLYLAQTLKSLVNQTLKDIEIVVVNDGSTDVNTAPILRHYEETDRRVVVFEQDNRGRSAARNRGNNSVSANIIAVCDADDVAHTDRARVICGYFKTHPDVDVFHSSFQTINIAGEPLANGLFLASKFDYEQVKKKLTTGIGHSTMAYRRRVVLDTPYDDGDYSRLGLDDWKLQLDLHKKGHKFGFTKKVLMLYRVNENGITKTRDKEEVLRLKRAYLEAHG